MLYIADPNDLLEKNIAQLYYDKLPIISYSLDEQLIYPTLEELDLLRKKFNSIVDIPYSKEIAKNNLYSHLNLYLYLHLQSSLHL